jgi:O-antigen ligase
MGTPPTGSFKANALFNIMTACNIMRMDLSARRWIYCLFCGAFLVLPMGTTPFTILGGLSVVVWILTGEFLKKRDAYLKASWSLPVLAMVALLWLGLIYTPDPHGLGLDYATKSYYWLYALALASISPDQREADYLIRAFLLGLLINALVGFMQLGGIVPAFSKWGAYKFTGFSGGYNTLAILLVLGMMIASFYFRIAASDRERLIYFAAMLAYFFHLLILEGRGGYLTLGLLLPVMVYNLTPRSRMLVGVLIYILAIGIMFSSPVLRNRVTQAIEGVRNHLDSGGDLASGKRYSEHFDRIYMWRWALELFMEHPFLGVGTGGYREAVLSAGGDKGVDHPHNNFLYMAASFGTLGILVLGWLFWVLLQMGWQNRQNSLGFFVMSSTLVILVGGLTDTHILDAGGAFLLALTTGLQSALPRGGSLNPRF